MGYSREKKQGGGVEDMEFPGGIEKIASRISKGLIKNDMEFPGGVPENIWDLFPGFLVCFSYALKFATGCG